MDTVLITGATSGIGRASTILLSKHGYRLIMTGRREERLVAISEELESPATYLVNDIADLNGLQHGLEQLPPAFRNIDILINNAGLALGSKPIDQGNPKDWQRMINTNVMGILNATHAVLPGMIEQGNGHIINIGSIASKEVYPNNAVYCATKHAVEALTKGMRMDLISKGIKVSQINPGLTETEFNLVRNEGNQEMANSLYQGFQALSPKDVAEAIVQLVELPREVNFTDLTIFPTAQATATVVHK